MAFSASTLAGLQLIANRLGVTVEQLQVEGAVPGGLMRRLNQLGRVYIAADSLPANWLRRVDSKLGKTPIECVIGSKEDLDALCAEIRK